MVVEVYPSVAIAMGIYWDGVCIGKMREMVTAILDTTQWTLVE